MAVDKKKREQERIKVQVAILCVMLVLVVFANRQKIFGGGTKKGQAGARAAGTSNSGAPSPSAPSGGAATIDSGGAAAPAQTPYDIPTLSPDVVTKLRARQSGRQVDEEVVSPKEIEKTVNPFTSFGTDADQLADDSGRTQAAAQPNQPKAVAQTSRAPRVTEVPRTLGAFHSFGVMILDGEKQAIIKRDGRVVPYHLKDGEKLEGVEGNFRVTVTGDNRVWIEDLDAPSADDRFFELGPGAPKPVGATPVRPPGKPGAGPESVPIFLDDTFE